MLIEINHFPYIAIRKLIVDRSFYNSVVKKFSWDIAHYYEIIIPNQPINICIFNESHKKYYKLYENNTKNRTLEEDILKKRYELYPMINKVIEILY